jgi:hypothetical protein
MNTMLGRAAVVEAVVPVVAGDFDPGEQALATSTSVTNPATISRRVDLEAGGGNRRELTIGQCAQAAFNCQPRLSI